MAYAPLCSCKLFAWQRTDLHRPFHFVYQIHHLLQALCGLISLSTSFQLHSLTTANAALKYYILMNWSNNNFCFLAWVDQVSWLALCFHFKIQSLSSFKIKWLLPSNWYKKSHLSTELQLLLGLSKRIRRLILFSLPLQSAICLSYSRSPSLTCLSPLFILLFQTELVSSEA